MLSAVASLAVCVCIAGVGLEDGAEDDEEFDEDEILGGDDVDDDDSKMTPLEEAAALAAAEKVRQCHVFAQHKQLKWIVHLAKKY